MLVSGAFPRRLRESRPARLDMPRTKAELRRMLRPPHAERRRFLALFLPESAPARWRRRHSRGPAAPLVAARDERGRRLVAAVSGAAQQAGIRPGLPLADARAFLPGL